MTLPLHPNRCTSCSNEFQSPVPMALCPSCWSRVEAQRLSTYKRQMGEKLNSILADELMLRGMGAVEAACSTAHVPMEIQKRLPREPLDQLRKGELPTNGFGLGGSVGCGKSGTMAALLAAATEARLQRRLMEMTRMPTVFDEAPWHRAPAFRWVVWPTTSTWIKGSFSRKVGLEEVEDFTFMACTIPLLVLDDLGRERMKVNYTEDFSFAQLDRIVDERSRNRRPILWTANANRLELSGFYGAAFMDRLIALAPLVTLPPLPSLRGKL
jgi:DNA replication protein DnaC